MSNIFPPKKWKNSWPAEPLFMRILLLLDVSSSMEGAPLKALCRASERLVDLQANHEKNSLDRFTELGIVTFSTEAKVVLPFSSIDDEKKRIRRVLSSIEAGGGTDYCCGLEKGNLLLSDAPDLGSYPDVGAIDVTVMVGDGEHLGEENPLVIVDRMKDKGILFFTVGIDSSDYGFNDKILREIASTIDGEHWYRLVKDFDALTDCFENMSGTLSGDLR